MWGPSARPYVSHPRAHALNKGRGSGAVCELDTSETQRSPAVAVGDFFRQPPCSVLRTFSWPSLQYAVLWQEGCNSLRLQLSTLAVSSNTARDRKKSCVRTELVSASVLCDTIISQRSVMPRSLSKFSRTDQRGDEGEDANDNQTHCWCLRAYACTTHW